jgi:hypothetical protein
MYRKNRLCIATLSIFLLLGRFAQGAVSFRSAQSYPVGTNPAAVAVGDFNHDGKRDLAVINSGDPTTGDDGSVSILFGKGDGTFQAAKNVAIGKNCTSIVAGDFDGDGNDDLALVRPGDATANDDGDVTIFLGNGDGTFRQGQVLTPGKNPSNNRGAIIALDLSGDQRLDLVVANAGDNTFSVVLGNGDGTFQSPVAYKVTSPPSSVLAVDLAGNGEKDLAVFRFGVDLWLGNGDGTFRQGPPSIEAGGRGVTAGDFNGDKKDDLVVTPFVLCLFHPCTPVYPVLHVGNGNGTFQAAISIGQPVQAAGDFDGDGKLDLAGLVSSNGSVQAEVLPGNGDGTFQPPTAFAVNSNESLSQVLDVNADGAPDVVLIGQNSIGLLVNVGTDFSISASALDPGTVNAGQSATSTVTLKLLSNFHNPVALTCSVQPATSGGATCSLGTNSITFDGSGNATATLTINTGSSAASLASPVSFRSFRGFALWLPVTGFAFLGTGFGLGISSRKRKVLMFLVEPVLAFGLIVELGCGGGSTVGGPKSRAYTVTVTGIAGATQHSATVNLTVQ